MGDILTVAKWEFTRGIKNKAFLVTILLVPLIIFIASVVPRYLMDRQEEKLVIVDMTYQVAQRVDESLEKQGIEVSLDVFTPEELRELAKEDKEKSYLYIPADFFQTKRVEYYAQSASAINLSGLTVDLEQVANWQEMRKLGLTHEEIQRLESKVQIQRVRVDQGAEKSFEDYLTGQIGLIGFGFLIVFTSMMAGGMTLQGIIKEKNDRIVEMLLSSVSSLALMAGKILGNLLVGIVQMVGLGTLGLLIARYGFDLPLGNLWSINLLYMGIYAILAYVLISTLYAFLGALMKEVQSGGQTQPLLGILPVVPMWFAAPIMSDPFGLTARVLSYIPFCTPMTMIMRIAVTEVPVWEIGLTIGILIIFNILMVNFVARIFKTGLLMYGKSASFKEAWRWYRQAM